MQTSADYLSPSKPDLPRYELPQIAKDVTFQPPAHTPLTLKYILNATFASTLSNIVGTIAGHPLDTIRVRMQLEGKHVTMATICRNTIANEGIRGFFKGMISPLVGVTPYNVSVFTITESLKKQMGQYELTRNMTEANKNFIGGSIAGTVSLVIYNPVELLKVRAQVNRQDFVKYRVEVPKIIRQEGALGLYKGFVPLLCRDAPAWGIYFWSYEYLQQITGIKQGNQSLVSAENIYSMLLLMWCGGVAGQLSWIIAYPFDVIKTEIQCEMNRKISMKMVAHEGYKNEGIRYFFKGLSPTLSRSFMVNAITLPIYDYLLRQGNNIEGSISN